MADQKIVQELKAAAADAIARGFAILICEQHDKNPWAKYSPHAINSATRDVNTIFKAWDDGFEANYGVAGGPSNLTIIDVDEGIPNYAALRTWMEAVGLPDTLIVQSGRDTSFGAHLYYSGAVATTPYTIEGVTGELRGVGAYVVGPGCFHPDSGKKYQIINDVTIASLPEGMVALAANKKKSMSDFQPGKGNLIPEGNRWAHLQVQAGKLKNMNLSEEGIYNALKDFASQNCENGDAYPDDKIKNLAEWAASPDCEGNEPTGIITFGSPDPEGEVSLPELPPDVVEGDYIGDLAGTLTAGTFIPPSFARADLKTILGSVLDGKVGFPGEETLHTRHWTGVISTKPETGKSVCWDRCIASLTPFLAKHDIKFPPAGFISSGEHAITVLAENDGKNHILYFDEMKSLFEKGSQGGSTLFPKLLELYEQKASAVGSLSNKSASFSNVSLSMAGNFTRAGFDRCVAGKGAAGDGFLSRMVLDFSNGINYVGDWDEMDTVKLAGVVQQISDAVAYVINYVGEINKGKPFVPEETPEGKHARIAFQKWLSGEKDRIQVDHPDSSYAARLEAHFKRDLLLRAIFTPERKITKELVEKSWLWTKHQLLLREELWPVDSGGTVEKFEKRIVTAINKQGPLTKSGLQKFSNADKGEGGYDAWNKAFYNLLQAGKVIKLDIKSDRGREKFGLDNAVWSKTKKKWIVGPV